MLNEDNKRIAFARPTSECIDALDDSVSLVRPWLVVEKATLNVDDEERRSHSGMVALMRLSAA
jgi:hypothetical protein